ncbi:hypothetical protein HRbin01_01750 [archaeon HR01]|nr:hypothetical protein HRbin01_01750 [archaeon HR01]
MLLHAVNIVGLEPPIKAEVGRKLSSSGSTGYDEPKFTKP